MNVTLFFLVCILLVFTEGKTLIKIEVGGKFTTHVAEPVTINFPTYDRRLNTLCLGATDTYMIDGTSDTLACVVSEVPLLFTETADLTGSGKEKVNLTVVKVDSTISTLKEIRFDDDGNFWWQKNKTCMMAYADNIICKLGTSDAVKDKTIAQKKCYFVHGVGESGPNMVIATFPGYWGNIAGFTPQCTERYFLWMDTRSRSFDDPKLLKTVCTLILNSTTVDSDIKNSYVFTHSMGGLIMTMAVMKGYCTIDKSSSRIYMSSPPLDGSQTALFVDKVCKGDYTELVQTVAKYMNYCRPGDLGAWPAYLPMFPGNPIFDSLRYAAGIYSNGFLCGDCNLTDVCGNGPVWQTAGLKALGVISGLGYPNDGMVTKASCESPFIKQPLRDTPSFSYYKGNMNHADSTCRNGDSVVRNSKACQWFSNLYITK